MIKVLVSACLLGDKVRYNGGAATTVNPVLHRWLDENRVVSFCPEIAGGLGVPRPAAEINGGGGHAVLDGTSRITARGEDVTDSFVRGARLALERAITENVGLAILKDGSPSCGSQYIYDGSFTGTRQPDRGVTAALLDREGIRVFNEHQFEDAAEYLNMLEGKRPCNPERLC
ncbi:MAG: DUF523 domain-containing protein [Blastocatellia bacterium]|nr:MAG: DUF523 domain-containing protein [Blastocatellia bacterium]